MWRWGDGSRSGNWCRVTWGFWFEIVDLSARFLGQLESFLTGTLVGDRASRGKAATPFGITMNVRHRNTVRIGAVPVDPNAANGLSCNGGDSCKKQEREKNRFDSSRIQDEFHGNESDRTK